MPNYICKISKTRGQARVTIPRELVLEAGLENVDHVQLILNINGNIVIRRVELHGEETTERKNGTHRKDR